MLAPQDQEEDTNTKNLEGESKVMCWADMVDYITSHWSLVSDLAEGDSCCYQEALLFPARWCHCVVGRKKCPKVSTNTLIPIPCWRSILIPILMEGVWRVSERCLECVWNVPGRCWEGVRKVFGRYDILKVSGGYLECVGTMSGSYL